MSSEDWKIVLLSLIATISGLGTAAIAAIVTIYGELLRKKANESKVALDTAKTAADVAKEVAVETKTEMVATKKAMNGRVDDLIAAMVKEKTAAVAEAYANGHADGMAKTAAAIAQSKKIPIDAQGVAEAIAAASHHD